MAAMWMAWLILRFPCLLSRWTLRRPVESKAFAMSAQAV
jgi:hypothetical protein